MDSSKIMESLQKFGRYSSRILNRSKPKKEEAACLNLVTDFREEKFIVVWRIENLHRCTLKCGEFLESPTFSTGFSSEVKWTLRLYPRGKKIEKPGERKTLSGHYSTVKDPEYAGLFIKRVSTDPNPAVKSSYKYRFSCERRLLNDTSKKNSVYFYPKEGVADMLSESTILSEYGTDSLTWVESLMPSQTFIVRCEIYVTNAYNMGASDNILPGPSKSDALSQDLKAIFDSGKLSDVTLQAGEVKFPAHKVILASRSEVFDAMFQHDMKENQTNIVNIENIEPAVLGNMLQYIYSGSIDDFNVEKAMALYSVADRYLLGELKEWCVDIMLSNLSVENVCQIAVLGNLHPDPKLKAATLNMFRNYTSDIFKRKEWKDMVRDTDRRALVSDILQAVSAEFTTNCSDDK